MSAKSQYLPRFGISRLRPTQEEVIDAVLAGENVLAVLPTGAGKSLCYQLPALAEDGITVIVSPLLALMRDQIAALQARGINAEMISSENSDEARATIWARLQTGAVKLLYLSPEQLSKISICYFLERLPVSRLVVDEAHCFSEWGHSFRPEYREISKFLRRNPTLKLSAFTATATKQVIQDLENNLFQSAPKRMICTPKRENIAIRFLQKRKPRQQLFDALGDEVALIYATTRNKTEVLAQALLGAGFDAAHYHAGLENDARRQIEADYLAGKIRVIVATTAFGMGVDKPDIRQVIHADPPASIEAFTQEIGRAGRDGKPAFALCLWSEEDFEFRRDMIDNQLDKDVERRGAHARLEAMAMLAKSGGGWDEIEQYFLQENVARAMPANDSAKAKLARWRYNTAQQKGIPPFWVLPDMVLDAIAANPPSTIDDIAAINGMGEKRLAKYGDEILALFGGERSNSRARQKLALSGDGKCFERIEEIGRELRYGVVGQEGPMRLSKPLIRRIVRARPTDHNALAQLDGMNAALMERFGDAILLEFQREES